jgi:lipoprotein-releasing system ATP-binding protein
MVRGRAGGPSAENEPVTEGPATVTTMASPANAESREGNARGPLIEARGLRKIYGAGEKAVTVLGGVDLAVEEGEMIAVVGPSGAGKSTLLHLVAALDTPTSGTVYFQTKALETHRDDVLAEFRNRRIGFVWQRHHLLPDFTAAENVAMPLLMRDVHYGQALEAATHWLGEVGLASRSQSQAAELSGGEQQRVAIARALVNAPAILLADEPTGDLDENNAVAIMDLIERLHRTHRLTSLVATHNPALAKRCDRVLRLERGVLRTDTGLQRAPSSVHKGEKS